MLTFHPLMMWVAIVGYLGEGLRAYSELLWWDLNRLVDFDEFFLCNVDVDW